MPDLYLVTGGAGFIGSHIASALLQRGDRVRLLDDLSTGRRENLDALGSGAEFQEGDLRSYEDCQRACRGVSGVFHQGALPSVPRSVADPLTSHQVNVDGTVNILIAAKEEGVRRVVFASSSSVYGNTPTLPKVETQTPGPLSPYALNKLVGEQYLRLWHQLYGLETVALRYFNVFGPRQDPKSQYAAVIPRFIEAALTGSRPTVYGDGEQSRDFTYIENVVAANMAAMRAPDAPGRAINAACGDRITLNQLLEEIGAIVGRRLEADYQPPRVGDVRHSLADITQAREVLGWEPRIDVREGLRRTIEHFASVFGVAAAR